MPLSCTIMTKGVQSNCNLFKPVSLNRKIRFGKMSEWVRSLLATEGKGYGHGEPYSMYL